MIRIINNDCLVAMKEMMDNSIDSVVTDPPYGISFMNKHWDYEVPSVDIWKEVLRILKPGGHILCACGTRTQHRMTVNIEDAGFEIRDVVAWIYGSGFPKSLDISKSIDKQYGVKREITGRRKHPTLKDTSLLTESKSAVYTLADTWKREWDLTSPATIEAQQYEGWGTALKPAMELWTLARKPLSEKNVASNVLKWGTGGINIDECRIEFKNESDKRVGIKDNQKGASGNPFDSGNNDGSISTYKDGGRFPSNIILDGSEEVVSEFPNSKSGSMNCISQGKNYGIYGKYKGHPVSAIASEGSAARFFYCAKASKSERNKGCEGMEEKHFQMRPFAEEGCDQSILKNRMNSKVGKNNHPTVKPIALMRYLCRLITPSKGIVLDPFMGSGSTGIGAKLEGFSFIGIEKEKEYCDIAEARIKSWKEEKFINKVIEQTLF